MLPDPFAAEDPGPDEKSCFGALPPPPSSSLPVQASEFRLVLQGLYM